MEDFSSRLRYMRALNGLTQQQLAADITERFSYPLTKMSISFYENNKRTPDINLLLILSKYFNCTVDFLLGLSNEPFAGDAIELSVKSDILTIVLKLLSQADLVTCCNLKEILTEFHKHYTTMQ